MNSFSDVIDALGVASASGILGIKQTHVRVLKARDSIPPDYFKRIVDSVQAREKGITFELLYKLRTDACSKQKRKKKKNKPRVRTTAQADARAA